MLRLIFKLVIREAIEEVKIEHTSHDDSLDVENVAHKDDADDVLALAQQAVCLLSRLCCGNNAARCRYLRSIDLQGHRE